MIFQNNKYYFNVIRLVFVVFMISLVANLGFSNQSKPKAVQKKGEVKVSNPVVIMETSKGTIEIELNSEKAPKSVENFLKYVDDGFYNGTIFHRVIKGFMIQGGGFNEKMDQKKTNAPIKNEAQNGLANNKYTLAMARTNDPDSATAQFFINSKDNAFLNYSSPANQGYAVFGHVVAGKEVVDSIEGVKTARMGYMDDVPTESVVIKSVKRK